MAPRLRFRRIRIRFCYLLELAVPPPAGPDPINLKHPSPIAYELSMTTSTFTVRSFLLSEFKIE